MMNSLIAAVVVALAFPALSLAGEHHADGDRSCAHPRTGTVTAGDSSAKGDRLVIPVAGMHCSMCAQRVTTALADVAGVKFVETSVDAKQAVVVFDAEKAKPEALASAVKSAGYSPGTPVAN